MIGDDDARSRDHVPLIKFAKYFTYAPLVVFHRSLSTKSHPTNPRRPRAADEIGKPYRYIVVISMKTQHYAITQSG